MGTGTGAGTGRGGEGGGEANMGNITQKTCGRDIKTGEDLAEDKNNKTRKYWFSRCQPRL